MLYSRDELLQRAEEFCRMHGITLGPQLGAGAQGVVFSTDRESAIKVHAAQAAYFRERDAYLRLAEFAVDQIHGLIVPRMRHSDDRLLIIEMTRVSPPFLLDFGGAFLDHPPDFLPDELARQEWEAEKREQFEGNWPELQVILRELELRYGIHLADVNPGNIRFDA
jgi:hypothetical protein